MSNDLLKLVDYLNSNKDEYNFLMNQYEKLIYELDYDSYSVEFLLKVIKTFENYQSEYENLNKQKNKFLKNIIKTIKFKLDLDFNTMKNESLVNCFYFLNTDFEIQNYEKLNNFIIKIRKKIFDILIKRGLRYYLHTKAGYKIEICKATKFFFQQYQVVIFKLIKKNDKRLLNSFLEKKEENLHLQKLDDELLNYKNN